MLIVDGDNHVVIVNPDRAVLAEYRLKQSELELERAEAEAPAHQAGRRPSTACTIELHANIELPGRPRAGARERRDRRRPVPLRVPVPQPRRAAVRGRAVRGVPRGRRRAWRASRSRSARSTSAPTSTKEGLDGLARVAPNPALGLARRALLPRRAAAVPHPAPRDPARVALRQGAHPDPDARVGRRDRPDARDDRAGEGDACASRACRSIAASRSAA